MSWMRNGSGYADPTAHAAIGMMTREEKRKMRKQETNQYPAARAYLDRVRQADFKVRRLEMQISNLKQLLTDRSVHLTDMPHSDSPDQQQMQTVFAEIDSLEREKAQAEAEAEAIRIEVGRMICKLSNPYSQEVRKRLKVGVIYRWTD